MTAAAAASSIGVMLWRAYLGLCFAFIAYIGAVLGWWCLELHVREWWLRLEPRRQRIACWWGLHRWALGINTLEQRGAHAGVQVVGLFFWRCVHCPASRYLGASVPANTNRRARVDA